MTLLRNIKTFRKISPNFCGLLRKADLYECSIPSSKNWLSRLYLAWEQSSFGIWIFSHMTESHHFILQGYSNNLYFHIFLSIWLCNKADLGLVQDTQKIVVVALVNEKMECHILGWISFWSAIIFLYDFTRYFFHFLTKGVSKFAHPSFEFFKVRFWLNTRQVLAGYSVPVISVYVYTL